MTGVIGDDDSNVRRLGLPSRKHGVEFEVGIDDKFSSYCRSHAIFVEHGAEDLETGRSLHRAVQQRVDEHSLSLRFTTTASGRKLHGVGVQVGQCTRALAVTRTRFGGRLKPST